MHTRAAILRFRFPNHRPASGLRRPIPDQQRRTEPHPDAKTALLLRQDENSPSRAMIFSL
jgi:hypothetical protein